jgi:hypothetical protein
MFKIPDSEIYLLMVKSETDLNLVKLLIYREGYHISVFFQDGDQWLCDIANGKDKGGYFCSGFNAGGNVIGKPYLNQQISNFILA